MPLRHRGRPTAGAREVGGIEGDGEVVEEEADISAMTAVVIGTGTAITMATVSKDRAASPAPEPENSTTRITQRGLDSNHEATAPTDGRHHERKISK